YFLASHHLELHRIPDLIVGWGVESVAVLPSLLIDTALIDSTLKRTVDCARILAGGRRKRKLRGSRRRVVGVRIRGRRRLLPASTLSPILKTKRGDRENRSRDY